MASPVGSHDLRATTCGALARRFLRESRQGRIAAVFDSSIYIRSAAGVACIGDESLPLCPLNVITNACRGTNWRAGGLRVDTPWRASRSTVYLGDSVRIHFGHARTWQPHRARADMDQRDLGRALRDLRSLAKTRAPEEGLATLTLARRPAALGHPVAEVAREPLRRLRRWLTSRLAGGPVGDSEASRLTRSLTGLGPGLTPSGDDLLGGMMVALHAFGRKDISDELWRALRPWAVGAGNDISLAHLSAASEGQGNAAVHALLHALQAGDCEAMKQHLEDIDRIGHTSGWDALAGVLTVADALAGLAHEKGDALILPLEK